uniref:Uncharacterized protein n=1 Tax=Oryza brachyantha TaxID=4533 RepID=J3MQ45_ORYBR
MVSPTTVGNALDLTHRFVKPMKEGIATNVCHPDSPSQHKPWLRPFQLSFPWNGNGLTYWLKHQLDTFHCCSPEVAKAICIIPCEKIMSDTAGLARSHVDGGNTDISETIPLISHQQGAHVPDLSMVSRGGKSKMYVAGEGVEEADCSAVVSLQQEDALHGVEDAVVFEGREADAGEGAGRQVEEADETAQLAVARVEAVALGEQHPPPRVEAPVDDAVAARAGCAGSPVGANGAEAGVVQQVAGQHPPRDRLQQILVQRRPRR